MEYSAWGEGDNGPRDSGGPSFAARAPKGLVLKPSVTLCFKMTHLRINAAPAAPLDLEKLFGVEGLSAGRSTKRPRWHAFLAHDIPVREQIWIGARFAALGLVPPLMFGVLLAAWLWATTPTHLW